LHTRKVRRFTLTHYSLLMKKFILSLTILLFSWTIANAQCPTLDVIASDVCSGYSLCGNCQSSDIQIQGTLPSNLTINSVKLLVSGNNVPAGQTNPPTTSSSIPAFYGQFPYYTYRNYSIAAGSNYVLQINFSGPAGNFNCNYAFSIALNTTPASPNFRVHAKTVSQVMAGQSFINTLFYANDPITFDASPSTNTMEYYIECTEVNSSGVAVGATNYGSMSYFPSLQEYYVNLRSTFSNLVNPSGMVMNKYYKIRMSAYGCSSTNPILYDKIITINAAARAIIIKQPLAIPPISGLVISPNPSNGTFTFTADELPDQLSVIVYNIDGKEVYNVSSTEEDRVEVAIDLGTQKPGMYFIQINTASEQLVEKIIIE